MSFSKRNLIKCEPDLAREFAEMISQDTRIKWIKPSPKDPSAELLISLDGRVHRFAPTFLATPNTSQIPGSPPRASSIRPLLVVPRLTDTFLRACEENEVSAIDLNGRVFLRAPGLLVSLPPLLGRKFRSDREPRNIYVGKSARIVRALLSDPKHLWRQSELIDRTAATTGLVSRIVTHLIAQGLLKKSDPRRFYVTSPLALLDAWAAQDDFSRRTTTHHFTALNDDPLRLARDIGSQLTHEGAKFSFTQWLAGWLRHPYTEPPIVSLYVPQLPPNSLLEKLGVRRASAPGRIWFHIPSDDGVFRETRVIEDLPLVADAQIYLDLLGTGLRGPEQAQALREWAGFLQP